MPKVRFSGDLVIGHKFPFQVGSFSFFLDKSISCNLSIFKKELCSLNHLNVPFGLAIILCILHVQ